MNSVCVVLPVSRETFLERVYASLELMTCDSSQTSILTFVDGDAALYVKARGLTQQSKFASRLTVHRPGSRPLRDHKLEERLKQIAQVHNELKPFVPDCEYVLLTEDDTLLPTDALQKLLRAYSEYPYAGFVSGVQINRHGFNSVGTWQVDDLYETDRIETLLPGNGLEEVDGAGLYTCLTKREHYVNHEFKPFHNTFGPDVDYGLSLRRQGYKNYVDWSVKTTHKTEARDIKFCNTELVKVVFTRKGSRWGVRLVND